MNRPTRDIEEVDILPEVMLTLSTGTVVEDNPGWNTLDFDVVSSKLEVVDCEETTSAAH